MGSNSMGDDGGQRSKKGGRKERREGGCRAGRGWGPALENGMELKGSLINGDEAQALLRSRNKRLRAWGWRGLTTAGALGPRRHTLKSSYPVASKACGGASQP